MFTNINKKSVKGFIQFWLQKYYPVLLGATIILYVFGIMFCAIRIWRIENELPEGSFNSYQFIHGFYGKRIDRTSFSVRTLGLFVKAKLNSKEEFLTEEELYKNYISEIVKTHYPDLDSNLIAAIVYHESRFRPDVVNKKTNATGLMQILPKWHTERAHKLGVTDLSDPYGNILVGCDILNEVVQSKKSMAYAIDFYAGGYQYADRYKNSVSPFRKELNQILEEQILGKE